jgi:hypothetical protein
VAGEKTALVSVLVKATTALATVWPWLFLTVADAFAPWVGVSAVKAVPLLSVIATVTEAEFALPEPGVELLQPGRERVGSMLTQPSLVPPPPQADKKPANRQAARKFIKLFILNCVNICEPS